MTIVNGCKSTIFGDKEVILHIGSLTLPKYKGCFLSTMSVAKRSGLAQMSYLESDN